MGSLSSASEQFPRMEQLQLEDRLQTLQLMESNKAKLIRSNSDQMNRKQVKKIRPLKR